MGHISKAVKQALPLSAPIPLPPEVVSYIDWIATADVGAFRSFWEEQLAALPRSVDDAAATQAAWCPPVPPAWLGDQPRFWSVSFHQLLHHFGLGDDRCVIQFISGFPAVGSFSQEGVAPLSDKHPSPDPVSTIRGPSVKRIKGGARA